MTSRAPAGSALLVIGPSLSQMSSYHKDNISQREREKILDEYSYQRWSESEQEGDEPEGGYVPGVRADEVAAADPPRKRRREDTGKANNREGSTKRRGDNRKASREASRRREDTGRASREGSRRREDTGKASRREDMGAIVAAAVSEGVAQGIQAAAAAAKASAPLPALPPASSSSANLGALSSVGAAGDDVLISRSLLRELVDHCNRLEQSARHAGRLSAGFAQECEQETRVFADIRSQLEARGLLRF